MWSSGHNLPQLKVILRNFSPKDLRAAARLSAMPRIRFTPDARKLSMTPTTEGEG
jgi:hypothetical protein